MQLDMFPAAAKKATPARRASQCGRNPEAGPGSCYHWWDLCPAKVKDCYSRATRELAARHGVQERQPITSHFGEALARMAARRRGVRTEEPACCNCGATDETPGNWRWVSFEPRLCSCCAGVKESA